MTTASLTAAVTVQAPRPGVRDTDLLNVVPVEDMAEGPWMFGVQWDDVSCVDAGSYEGLCIPSGETKTADGIGSTEGPPFVVHAAVACRGFDVAAYADAAAEALRLKASVEVENRLVKWAVNLPQAQVTISEESNVVRGLGKLEELVAQYGGRGLIHLTPLYATIAASNHLLTRENGRTVTLLGTPVVVGHGYEHNARMTVGGYQPPAGDAWAWVSGALRFLRSPVKVTEAFDRRTNDRVAVAERVFVPVLDCMFGGLVLKGGNP